MPQQLHKRDYGGVSHPAPFSDAQMVKFRQLLPVAAYPFVLDPFAGTGRVHELPNETVGIELEPEWATLHENTIVADAISAMSAFVSAGTKFDAIVTSPCYGNRLADHHNASDPHARRSYTHDLGRPLTEGNSGAMQWHPLPGDDAYRALHRSVWGLSHRILRDAGRFVLCIKDHIRDGAMQPVTAWHVATIVGYGFDLIDAWDCGAHHLRQGANQERGTEWVITFRRYP